MRPRARANRVVSGLVASRCVGRVHLAGRGLRVSPMRVLCIVASGARECRGTEGLGPARAWARRVASARLSGWVVGFVLDLAQPPSLLRLLHSAMGRCGYLHLAECAERAQNESRAAGRAALPFLTWLPAQRVRKSRTRLPRAATLVGTSPRIASRPSASTSPATTTSTCS